MDLNEQMKLATEIATILKKKRLSIELSNHKATMEQKKPQDVESSDNIFKSAKKQFGNFIHSGSYDHHKKLSEELETSISKIDDLISQYNIDQAISDEAIIEKVDTLFKEDKYGLAKLDFAINIILDKEVKYEVDDYTFPVLSNLLHEDKNYLAKIKESFFKTYNELTFNSGISISDADFSSIVATGGILCVASIPVFAALGIFAAATVPVAATILAGLGIAGAVTILAGGYGLYSGIKDGNINDNLKKLKDDFYKLTPEETIFNLARSIMMLEKIHSFKDDPEAEEIYGNYIEEYIDIKSDITLKLLLGKDTKENLKKNKIFSNVDSLLVKRLELNNNQEK